MHTWITSLKSIHYTLIVWVMGPVPLLQIRRISPPLWEGSRPSKTRHSRLWVRDLCPETILAWFGYIPRRQRMALVTKTATKIPFQCRQSFVRLRSVVLSPTRNTSPFRYQKKTRVLMMRGGGVRLRNSSNDLSL